MEFKPIHAPSSTDLFVDQLKAAILTGKYRPGDKLPSERQLEKQLCVSRAVINAGLKRLQDLHFITIRPRYGTFIADYRTEGDLTTMNEIINFHGGHYRIPLLKSIYRLRLQLEDDVIRLAARAGDPTSLQAASHALAALANMTTPQAQAERYFAFIHALAVASQNDVYPLLINNFRPLYLTLGKWTFEVVNLEEMVAANQHLLALIRDGAAKAAVTANRQLVKDSYRQLTGMDYLEPLAAAPAPGIGAGERVQ